MITNPFTENLPDTLEGDDTGIKEPNYRGKAYICPWCLVFAHQQWWTGQRIVKYQNSKSYKMGEEIHGLGVSVCQGCKKYALWMDKELIYPAGSAAPIPVVDMPDDVMEDFWEARTVFDKSPRSAAALLRLALQKLMPHLGETGDNINTDIKSLVNKGLPVQLQQALDTVRVIGNNAVHPGQIDVADNNGTAASLFGLLNFIVNKMITEPKQVAELYASLPPSSREAIKKRDEG